jgi:hypothetical protein
MRFPRRVVQTAALIRDRPVGVVNSAARAFSLRIRQFAYATPFRLVARTPQRQSDIRTGLCRARPSCRMVSGTSSFFEFFALHLPPSSRTGRC